MGYFSCPVCEQNTISNLQELQLRVTRALSSNIKCPICSSNLNGISNLQSHLSSHMSINYNSTFSEQRTLPMEQTPAIEKLEIRDEWIQSEVNSQPAHHNCDLCGLVFSTEYFLTIHKEILHSNSDAFEISCKLCKFKFPDLEIYRNHVNDVHSGERHFCQECPKSFKVKGGLLVHTRVFHDKTSPTYCTICKKSFTNKTRKEIHDKKYHCGETKKVPINPTVNSNNVLQTNNLPPTHLIPNDNRISYIKQNTSENIVPANPEMLKNNINFTEEQTVNCHSRNDNSHSVMISKTTGYVSEIAMRATNLENNILYNIQQDGISNVDKNIPNSSPVQINLVNSLPLPMAPSYQNQTQKVLDYSVNNSNFGDIDGPKSYEDYTIFPVFKNTLRDSTSSNPDLFTSHANLEKDDPKLLELLLWSNNSSTNTNFSHLSTTDINVQAQPEESATFPSYKDSLIVQPNTTTTTTLVPESFPNNEEVLILTPSPKEAEQANSPQMPDESPKPNDNKMWQCEECKKLFTTKYFLKKHKRLHTGETPYSCAECGKTFTFQQSYHKHVFYHTNEKPHRCPQCGRSFKEMSTLHNHIRIHTGEKPFVCTSCGKAFRQRVSYLVHQRIHTGQMPYSCDTCKRTFRYKVSLRSHKCQIAPEQPKINQNTMICDLFNSNISSENAVPTNTDVSVIGVSSTGNTNPVQYLSNTTALNTQLCSSQTDPLSAEFDKDLFIHNLLS